MDIQIGKRYRYKAGGFTMQPVVTPIFIGATGIMVQVNSPKCWKLRRKEEIFSFEKFESKYKLAEKPWQESDHYDDYR